LKRKKTYICCLSLIPNEKFEIYEFLLSFIKKEYKFNPKILTIDFCKYIIKAIKSIFPSFLIIRCFFHWVKVLWANLKKLRYTDKEKINKTKRLLPNIKIMAFIEPKLHK